MNYKLNGLLFNNAHLLDLTRSEYWTLHAIVSFMNEKTGACFPSTDQITKTSHVYYRCVIAAIKSLEKKGFFRTEQKVGCRRNFIINMDKFQPLLKTTPLSEIAPLPNIAPPPLLKTTGDPCEKTHPSPAKNSTRTENITEKETENTNREVVGRSDESEAPLLTPTEPVSSPKVKKANGKGKQLITKVFFVNEIKDLPTTWKDYCIKKKPGLDPESTFEKFVDYYDAKRERKKFENWTLTWYRWVRNEKVTLATIYANEKKQVVNGNGKQRIKCPFRKIIGIYREELPSLPQMEMVTEKVQKDTESFWDIMVNFGGATTEEEGLVTTRQYFNSVSRTDFLMGRGNRGQTWTANFGWLVDPENVAKVINGNYESKQ